MKIFIKNSASIYMPGKSRKLTPLQERAKKKLGFLQQQAKKAVAKKKRYAEQAERFTKQNTWHRALEEDFLKNGFKFTLGKQTLFKESAINVDSEKLHEKKQEIASHHMREIRNFK